MVERKHSLSGKKNHPELCKVEPQGEHQQKKKAQNVTLKLVDDSLLHKREV